jgi:hypothetical protein
LQKHGIAHTRAEKEENPATLAEPSTSAMYVQYLFVVRLPALFAFNYIILVPTSRAAATPSSETETETAASSFIIEPSNYCGAATSDWKRQPQPEPIRKRGSSELTDTSSSDYCQEVQVID